MKKILITIFVVAVSVYASASANADSSNVSLEKFKKIKAFNDKNFQLLKAQKLSGGEYLVHGIARGRKGFVGIDILVSSDLKHMSIGRTVDTETNKHVQLQLSPKDIEAVKKFKEKYILPSFEKDKKIAPVVYGNGKTEFFLFTDPDCPFCKRLEKQFRNRGLKKQFKIYVFPIHLNIRGHQLKTVEYILSKPRDKRREAMSDLMVGNKKDFNNFKSTPKTKKIVDDWVKKVGSLENYYNIRGTPSIIDQYGADVRDRDFLFKSNQKK